MYHRNLHLINNVIRILLNSKNVKENLNEYQRVGMGYIDKENMGIGM